MIISKILPCDKNNVIASDFFEWFVTACQILETDLRTLSDSGILSHRHVLLENTPLVKFMRNYIRNPSGVFSSFISEDIYDVISRFFTVEVVIKRKFNGVQNNTILIRCALSYTIVFTTRNCSLEKINVKELGRTAV